MRGADGYNEQLLTQIKLEYFVPASHPLRPIRQWVNEVLVSMNGLFNAMYEADIKGGRPSIAPEKLLRAMLLQMFYSICSEQQLMEQTPYNLLFRWFLGLSVDDVVWNHSVFTKNWDRLIEHDAVTTFFERTVQMALQQVLLSDEHFSVDSRLIDAWAGHKSFRRKDDTVTTGTRPGTGTRRNARTRLISLEQTRRQSCTAKARGQRPSCATRSMY